MRSVGDGGGEERRSEPPWTSAIKTHICEKISNNQKRRNDGNYNDKHSYINYPCRV